LQDAPFNLNYFTAKARCASAHHVNLAIDHLG
jgi:hypothetical protein